MGCGDMTFLGMTRSATQEKAATAERGGVHRATPDPVRGLHRALGNQALADMGAVLHRCPGGYGPTEEPATAPPIVGTVLRSVGQPMDTRSRTLMESRFGHDFGSVRMHTDALAARSAQAVGANAYTVGDHVVMGAGFQAGTTAGQRLLAHELTHVVQQDGAAPRLAGSLRVGAVNDPLEHEAHATAERVVAGAGVDVRGRGGGHAVRRDPAHAVRDIGPVDWKPGMRGVLLEDIVTERDGFGDPRRVVKAGTLVEVTAIQRFGFVQAQPVDPKLRRKEPLQVNVIKIDQVFGPEVAPATTPASTTAQGGTASPVLVPVPVALAASATCSHRRPVAASTRCARSSAGWARRPSRWVCRGNGPRWSATSPARPSS